MDCTSYRAVRGRGGPVQPSTGEPRDLFLAWQGDGDRHAREELLRRYMPLARRLARRYTHSSEPFEDLLQVAYVGLLHAIDRYDADRGLRFAAFAVPTILGEMRRYFRDAGWALHVPRASKERALEVRDATEEMRTLTGRSPTVKQLAQYMERELEQVLDGMLALDAYRTRSLDAPRTSDDGPAGSYTETVGCDDERFELIDCDAAICVALSEIAPRERLILRLRFVDDLTQSEIAARVGISQMQVSRLLRRSLDRLRAVANQS
ncbi:MAG TPA: SigB/SigF/SigG family RNA polymerase sigma factor [Solirubrobacteraceae bacterium]|nr:SigB/SigF/SigG family RNA polymerase sigma factor [Solirubrobacteraceae bacterium]